MTPPWLHSADKVASIDFNIAIGLKKNSNNTFHSGLFYKIKDENKIYFLHLANHNVFVNEDVTDGTDGHFVVPRLPDMISRTLSGFCKLIADQHANGDFPYSFMMPVSNIWSSEGLLTIKGLSNGLTCSHFVLSVFLANNIEILCRNEWPHRSEDRQFQMNFIFNLHKYHCNKALYGLANACTNDSPEAMPGCIQEHQLVLGHIQNMINEIGSLRYSPIEVAAGASANPIPAPYSYTESTVRSLKPIL